MVRLLMRLALTAFAFAAILPRIPGITFHGSVFNAMMLAIMFSLILWVVDVVAIAMSAAVAIGTLGMALLWLVPLWVLGFWLLPAVALKVVSDVTPFLSIQGWLPAVFGGLVMLFIGMLTSGHFARHERI